MSPKNKKKLNFLRKSLDKLDNNLLQIIKTRSNLVNEVLKLKEFKSEIVDKKNIDLLKKVKFLLKDQGMTIKGVKKVLNDNNSIDLDEVANKSISAVKIKVKLEKISKIIKTLKN